MTGNLQNGVCVVNYAIGERTDVEAVVAGIKSDGSHPLAEELKAWFTAALAARWK